MHSDIIATRWDKVDPYDYDLTSIDQDAVFSFVESFANEKGFLAALGIDDNITKYSSFMKKGKYNPKKVTQSLMRILNVFRKRYKQDGINNLDELKLAGIMLEESIRASLE